MGRSSWSRWQVLAYARVEPVQLAVCTELTISTKSPTTPPPAEEVLHAELAPLHPSPKHDAHTRWESKRLSGSISGVVDQNDAPATRCVSRALSDSWQKAVARWARARPRGLETQKLTATHKAKRARYRHNTQCLFDPVDGGGQQLVEYEALLRRSQRIDRCDVGDDAHG
eukprot:7385054-Prymnesium_polylepis.1